MSDFDWSQIQTAEALEDSRAYRFRPEWRPIILSYMGLLPGMHVLEVGCGPGTFAPYLAEGIRPGRVTGLDLDPRFIERARAKAEYGGIPNVEYVVGSAYELPFPDASFDAATSYTGVGVLTDPERAVQEMARVCRPGGPISLIEPVTGPFGIFSEGLDQVEGAETYPGAAQRCKLRDKLHGALAQLGPGTPRLGSKAWPVRSFLSLLARLGLTDLELNAWGYGRTPDDHRLPDEHRRQLRTHEYEDERRRLESLLSANGGSVLAERGFTQRELQELITLTEDRYRWLLEHPLYDWEGGVSFVAAGRKPRS